MRLFSIKRGPLRRFRKDESGSPTVEFVILFPLYIFMFCAAWEIGMFNLRQIWLDRAVDQTLRILRTRNYPEDWRVVGTENFEVTAKRVREKICDLVPMISDCDDTLFIGMASMGKMRDATFSELEFEVKCNNRATDDVDESLNNKFTPGGQNEVLVFKACWFYTPFIPTLGILGGTYGFGNPLDGLLDSKGGLAIISTAAMAIEPK